MRRSSFAAASSAAIVLFACAGAAVASDNLIGINFTTATRALPDPQNWSRISDTAGTLFNLTDDTGAVTGVSVQWTAPNLVVAGTAVAANLIPQHTYDLGGMIGYRFATNDDVYSVTFSGLNPNAPYEYWFVAHRATLGIDQTVRVSDGDVPDAISFTQVKPSTAAFVINDQISSDTQVWDDLSFETFSSSTGTVTFTWQRNASNPALIGAVAIRSLVPPEPFDVRINSSVSADSVSVGDNVTFTFNVLNPSPANVTGVVVDIELPAGLNYVSDDRGGVLTGNILSANLGDLNAGDDTTINVVTNPSAPGIFVVEAEVDINELDPNPDNNTTTASVNVGETDLGVSLVASANPVVISSNPAVDFTINYNNLGLINATDTQIVFTAPPELNITGASAGVISGNTVTLDIPSFTGGNSDSFTVNTTATAPNANAVASVEISHAGLDPDPSNDSAEVSLLIVQSAADFPDIETIFTNVDTLNNSIVPGRPSFRFNNNAAGNLTTAFMRPYASPDGSLWILRAGIDGGTGQDQVVLVGAGTQGTAVLGRGDLDPVQAPGGFNAIALIDEAMSINNSGDWVIRTRDDNTGNIEHFILKFDAATAEFSKVAKTGDPVPGIPGAEYNTLFDSANITNTGQVGFIAGNFNGVPTTEDRAAIFDGQVLHQRGVTSPTGIGLDPTNTWNFLTANTFEMNADGTSHIIRGTVNNSPTGETNVTAVNNEAVVRSGNPIPGNTVLTGTANTPGNQIMNGAGDWMVRGNTNEGPADRNVLLNGEVVAWNTGPTGLPDNSVWDNSEFSGLFFLMASNNDGGYVIGGLTDTLDTSRDAVIVYYCSNGDAFELMREGDPVDLSGNGQFDDNAFIDRWQNDRLFINETHAYFVAQIRDTLEENNNRFGQGFFRIELPDCGAPACPADLNGDGVVDADDFFLFLSLFAAGDTRADINGDGVIDADDFFAYLSLFAAGC